MPNITHTRRTSNGQNPPRRGPRRKKRKLRIIPVILVFLLLFSLIGGITLSVWVLSLAKDLPEITPENFSPQQASLVYDNQDNNYARLHSGENRISVPLNEIPQHLKDVVIATEDIRFYSHFGIDIRRVFGAIKADILSGSFDQGASTITMQLTRNAILETQAKKLERKVKEALLSVKLEKEYSKDDILYFYLNEVHFGHGTYGVQAACNLYFNKPVQEITLSESAMLAGLLRSPKNYSPYNNMERALAIRNVALDNLVRYKPEYSEAAAEAKEQELIVSENHNDTLAATYEYPWFTDYVVHQAEDILEDLGYDSMLIYTGGFSIYTTLEPVIQGKMEELYQDEENFPSSSTGDLVESSMVIMDPHSGEIKGLIGGREHLTRRGFNRATSLTRQPGSIIKPVAVYGPAIEAGLSPASVTDDCPTTFGKDYAPKNYDGKWRGLISMREAIKYSVNMSAVKTLQQIGTSTGLKFAQRLGLPLSDNADNNLALALGGITEGVSPLDMAGAYSAFAGGGIYTKPYCVRKIVDSKGNTLYEAKPYQETVMSEQTAYLITDMLISVTTGGTGTNARMNRPVASKTGTTQLPDKAIFKNAKGNKDAWFAAYTPELVGVVWMGYDNDVDEDGKAQYLRQIYGGKYPALLWKAVMTTALKDTPVKSFKQPPGMVTLSIDKKSGLLPSELTPAEFVGSEIFNKNNIPKEASNIWQVVEIDEETNMLASAFCPNKASVVRLIPPEVDPAKVEFRKSADGPLYAPEEICNIHTTYIPGSENGDEFDYDDEGNIIIRPDNGGENNGDNNGDNKLPEQSKLYTPKSFAINLKDIEGNKTASLTWADNNDPAKTLYIIERIKNGEEESRLKFTTYGKSLEDPSIETGNTYRYRVYAYSEEKNILSDWSKTLTIKP